LTDGLLDLLVGFSSNDEQKGVLFCATDKAVLFVDKHRQELRQNWNLFLSNVFSLEYLMDKSRMMAFAREAGFSIPNTVVLSRGQEFTRDSIPSWGGPCIVKPVDSLSVGKEFYRIVLDKEALFSAAESLLGVCSKIMVQEYIGAGLPGEVLEVFALRGRLPPHNKQVCIISKERQYPFMTGSSSFIKTELVAELYQPVCRFLDLIEFEGIADIEVVRRDGEFFFIEANFRCGTPIALSQRAGLNLPALAYFDAIGEAVAPRNEFTAGIHWLRDDTDWKHVFEGRVPAGKFVRDVLRTSEFLVFATDDPRPFLYHLFSLLKKGLRYSSYAV
jgi:predicted ATP-grasp superfamily ATP-dependent carboligase